MIGTIKKFAKYLFLISLSVMIVCYYFREDLPPRYQILPEMFNEPKQIKTKLPPFFIHKKKYQAEINPLFHYQLYGLVVSDYDSETWYDYFHKFDPFNTKDICVVWGKNLQSDIYLKTDFWHGEFTCFARMRPGTKIKDFNINQLANNHLIPANKELYKKIKKAKIGDQIFLSGYLVNSKIQGPNGLSSYRNSSITRQDTGKNACEVVYTTDFKILKTGRPIISFLYALSTYLAIASFLIFSFAFYRESQRGWQYLRAWEEQGKK